MSDRKKSGVVYCAGAVLAGFLVPLVGIFAWHSSWKTLTVPDVCHAADIDLAAGSGSINGVTVWLSGSIDGTAEIWAEGWDRQIVSGQVDWRVYHDWFSQGCKLHYQPQGVTNGKLVVRYRFH
jgi:hypothetical protein